MNFVLTRLVHIGPELVVRTILFALTVVFLHGIIDGLFNFEVPRLAWVIAAAALWIPMTVGLYRRGGEATFRPSRELNRQQKLRRWAAALWMTPAVMLFPLWLGLLYQPSVLIEYWDLYVLFFGLPFTVAAALYFYSARVDASS